MKVTKFSKSYSNMAKIQEDYINENFLNLKNILKINKKYSLQKKGKLVKIVIIKFKNLFF